MTQAPEFSKMEIRYRVVSVGQTLYSGYTYEDAEAWCWKYTGGKVIKIEMVWIPRLPKIF